MAALELGQTIVEEEIQRASHMSSPSRVRRSLWCILVVLVVALSIEALVAVFRFGRDEPSNLHYAAAIGLMAAQGLFMRLNLGAEELEPRVLAAARRDDHKAQATRRRAGQAGAPLRTRPTPAQGVVCATCMGDRSTLEAHNSWSASWASI